MSILTVGICAFNEEKNIGTLLNNVLYEQELPVNSEVLVVCSGCTDTTTDIVQKFAAKDSRLKVNIEDKRSGKASAINYILSNATGDVILFVSADTLPKKGSFSRLISKLQMPNVGIVCGNPMPINPPTSIVGRLVQLLWNFHGHVFEELNDSGLARHATEIFCIRKGIVDKIPAETVNDDAYLAVTAKKKGWLIKFDAQSQVLICGPNSFQEYFQQRRRIIFGHFQIRKLTGESPQYLVHLMPLHPLQTLKLIFWLFTRYNPTTVATFLFTEFWVNVFAMGDFIFGKTYFRWSALSSTKTVFNQQETLPKMVKPKV
ncbi:MAG: glycosyltransferase [Chloroflexi bacterium]|nr:glycosyltransferase [Chloroflexota bacterium]